MNDEQLRVIAPDPHVHGEALFALLDLEWPGSGASARAGQIAGSHYDWGTSRIGLLGDQIVTHFGVYDLRVRVGAARVRAAGVNLVATHPAARGRGLMTRTGHAAVAAMRERGYDMSLICNGSAGFYGRFGYVFAWPELDFVIATEQLPVEPPLFELLDCPTGQPDELAALYNRENELVTGTAVRPTFPHGKHPGNGRGCRWADQGGATAGYIFYDIHEPSGTLWHDDSAGDVEQRLRALGLLARRFGCAQVRCERLPYRSALGRRLRQLSCHAEAKYVAGGGWMARALGLRGLFERLAPELERRLAGSPLAGWSGDLRVAGDEQAVTLRVERGRVHVAPPADTPHALRAGAALVQLVLGSEAPEELAATTPIELSGDAGRLLPVLFPAQHPQMSNDDL